MSIPHEITDLIRFIEASPTAWHAVEEIAKSLSNVGFIPLKEEEPWSLQPGGKYFTSRNGSSLCAFIVPQQELRKALILASHTDSPGMKLKPNPEFKVQNQVMWGVETYGEPLLSSWLNRDLGLAGRIVYRDPSGTLKDQLVHLRNAPAFIPQLAVHLDREVNEKGLYLNRQDHLCALAALTTDLPEDACYLDSLLKKECAYQSLIATDLFLFPLEAPKLCGNHGQLICSYRLDNLASVHASLRALLKNHHPTMHSLQMAIFWDNEEIGSRTAQGADSPFLENTLDRIAWNLNLRPDDFFRLRANSFCVSIDLAHAINANYAQKHEPRHPIYLDKGIVIKMNANQRYATDAQSAAVIENFSDLHDIPYQKFTVRSDMPCGSTVGPINAAKTGIKTVDIGCPQLSMHSIREAISCKDHLAMCQLLEALLKEF